MAYLFKKPEDSTKALETPQQFAGMGTAPIAPQAQPMQTDVAAGAGREIMRGNVGRGAQGVTETLLKPIKEQTAAIKQSVVEQAGKYRQDTSNLASSFGSEYSPETLNKAIAGENTVPEYKNIQSILGYVQKPPEDISYSGRRPGAVVEPIKQGTIAENLQKTKKYGTGLANIDAALFGTGKNYGNVVQQAQKLGNEASAAIGQLESGELERQRQEELKNVIAGKKEQIRKDIGNLKTQIKGGLETKAGQTNEQAKVQASEADKALIKSIQDKFDQYIADWLAAKQDTESYIAEQDPNMVTVSPLLGETLGATDKQLADIKGGLSKYVTGANAPIATWQDVMTQPEYTQLSNLSNLLGEPIDFKIGAGAPQIGAGSFNEQQLLQDLQNIINPAKENITKGKVETGRSVIPKTVRPFQPSVTYTPAQGGGYIPPSAQPEPAMTLPPEPTFNEETGVTSQPGYPMGGLVGGTPGGREPAPFGRGAYSMPVSPTQVNAPMYQPSNVIDTRSGGINYGGGGNATSSAVEQMSVITNAIRQAIEAAKQSRYRIEPE